MFFRQVFDDKLAQYAYLIGCQATGEAIVIDPERDIQRYLDIAAEEDLRIVAVTETHIHADFLSGCLEFVDQVGTTAYLSGEGGEGWAYGWADRSPNVKLLAHGDRFHIGNIEFEARHTPGHTPEHMSFLVTDHGGGASEPMGLVSGDFVFVGDLGRPDLLETAAGQSGAMEPAAKRLYASAKGVFEMPEYMQIWPGHGAGSACGKALGAVPDTTVGYELRFSPALAAVKQGESSFVSYILAGQPEPPLYFARMKHQNRDGPPLLAGLPEPSRASADKLMQVAGQEDWVVLDTRPDRLDYYAGHIPGSIYAPMNKAFSAAVGSYVLPEHRILLVCEEGEVGEAVRALIRIGLDQIEGWAPPSVINDVKAAGGSLKTIESIDCDTMAKRVGPGAHVLDVRRATEHEEGHLEGSTNVAHTRLAARLGEVPGDKTLLVHCRTGARVSAAVSFLEREGYDVVAVNDVFPEWLEHVRGPKKGGALAS
ncbi:MAG: MBL fold metallo-hydrolase [Longimicrobiales bacterium]